MGALSLSSLPLGFRFRPTDEELIDFYLRSKINGNDKDVLVIREIDVCKVEPWDLPDLSVIKTTDSEWFFFCPRDRKYPHGNRLNRATAAGYWKATGKDRNIKSGTILIGMKKTLVFYAGRAPRGKRTNWVMHEYRPTLKELDGTNPGQSAYVLCRLFRKQDETIEDFNGDSVEPIVSSSATAKSSPEDTQSDAVFNPASPVLREQAENSFECTNVVEDTNRKAPDTPGTLECDVNITDVYDAAEMDPLLDIFFEPASDPLFSPLEVQAEFGSCFFNPVADDLSNNGLQLHYGTNEPDDSISEFLNSVLRSDELSHEEAYNQKNLTIDDSGIYSGSEAQAMFEEEFQGAVCSGAPSQMLTTAEDYGTQTSDCMIHSHERNLDLLQDGACIQNVLESNSLGIGDEDFIVSRIIRRPHPVQNPYTRRDDVQGTASRRIRLDTKYHVQARRRSLSIQMFRLAGVMVLFVMCISIWRCLKL